MIKNKNGKVKIGPESVFFAVIFLGMLALISFYVGCAPGITIPNLGVNLSLAISPEYPPFYRGDILYPFGLECNEGFGIRLVLYFFRILGMNLEFAWSMTNFVLFTVSFFSSYTLFLIISHNKWIALAGAILLYMNPFISVHESIFVVYFGVIFIPLCILSDFALFKKIYNQQTIKISQKWFYFAITLSIRLWLVSLGWYTAVITAAGSCLFWLLEVVSDIKQKKLRELVKYYIGYILVPWIIAMAVFMLITPSGTSQFGSELEFINGQSVDLLTLILPGNSQLIGKYGISFNNFLAAGQSLTGDGNTWKNYLGWTMFISVLCVGVKYKRNISKHWYIIGCVFAIILIIAIGPGIKFLQTTDEITGTYQSYLLSFDGMIRLPWYGMYKIFPFSMMRANYRWIALPIILLIAAFVKSMSKLCKYTTKSKVLIMVLIFMAFFEYYPADGFIGTISTKVKNYYTLEKLDQEIIKEIRENVPEKSRIVVCTYDYSPNAYLIQYISAKCGLLSYTGAGDKAMALADQYVPSAANELQTASDPELLAKYIVETLEKQICDYVILPYYSLRDNSYSWSGWPPSTDIAEHTSTIAKAAMEYLGDSYCIIQGKQHLFVSKIAVSEGYELLADSDVEMKKVTESNRLYNSRTAYSLDNNERFVFEQKINANDNKLYCQFYLKGEDEVNIPVLISQFNESGLLREEEFMLQLNSSYELLEKEYHLMDGVTKVKISIINTANEDVRIKNIFCQSYNSNIVPITSEVRKLREKGWTDTIEASNTVCYDDYIELQANSFAKFSTNTSSDEKKLHISVEFIDDQWAESSSYSIVSMMDAWADNMTCYIGGKEQYYHVTFSNDGKSTKSIWLEKSLFNSNDWNCLDVWFENGLCKIWVNGILCSEEELGFDTLFSSDLPLTIGGGMQGKVKNLKFEF